MAELRVIQAGAGFWGTGWAKVLTESRWAQLEALVDIDGEALHRVADSVALPLIADFPRSETRWRVAT